MMEQEAAARFSVRRQSQIVFDLNHLFCEQRRNLMAIQRLTLSQISISTI